MKTEYIDISYKEEKAETSKNGTRNLASLSFKLCVALVKIHLFPHTYNFSEERLIILRERNFQAIGRLAIDLYLAFKQQTAVIFD